MTRDEFLTQLRQQIGQLPQEELQDVMNYYTEYFDDAGAENEQSVIDQLGSPEAVAREAMGGFGGGKAEDKGSNAQAARVDETASKELEQLTELDISTISACIVIETGPAYSIAIENNNTIVGLRYTVERGKLKVVEKQVGHNLFGSRSNHLTITLPKGVALTQAKVKSVSGSLDIRGFCADTLMASTTSGGIYVQDVQTKELFLSSVSGKIELKGDVQQMVRAKTVAGKVFLAGKLLGEIWATTVSGRIELNVTDPLGAYSYECSSISGRIQVGGSSAKRRLTGGSGKNKLNLSSVSGNLIATFQE